jgi:hypothetical protein
MRIDVLRRLRGVCTKCGGSGFFYRVPETATSEQARFAKSRRTRVRCKCGANDRNEEDIERWFVVEGQLLRAMLRAQDREERG